jgi:hypothetical protein
LAGHMSFVFHHVVERRYESVAAKRRKNAAHGASHG